MQNLGKVYEIVETARHNPEIGYAPCKLFVRGVSRRVGSFAQCVGYIRGEIKPEDTYRLITWQGHRLEMTGAAFLGMNGSIEVTPESMIMPDSATPPGEWQFEHKGKRWTLTRPYGNDPLWQEYSFNIGENPNRAPGVKYSGRI